MSDAAPPPWVKRAPGLSAAHKFMLGVLWGYGPYRGRPELWLEVDGDLQPRQPARCWESCAELAKLTGEREATVRNQLRKLARAGWILRGKGSMRTLAWRAPGVFAYGALATDGQVLATGDPGHICTPPGHTCPPPGHVWPPKVATDGPQTLQELSNSTSNQLAAAAREEPDPHGHTPAGTSTQAPPSSSTTSYTSRDPRQDIERDRAGIRSQPERLAEGLDADAAGDPALPGSTAGRVANAGRPAHVEAVHARAPEPRGYGSGPGVTSGRPGAQPRRGGGDHPGSERGLAERNAQADRDERARLARIEARRSGRGLSTQTDAVAFEQAVCEAAPSWSARMQNRPQWRQRMHEARDALRLTPEQGARVASKWERDAAGGISPGQPDLDELWSTYSTKRDWLREAAGLGESKPARKSGALPMEGGGGKTKPRRVRAFENKATYDARIAREAAAS